MFAGGPDESLVVLLDAPPAVDTQLFVPDFFLPFEDLHFWDRMSESHENQTMLLTVAPPLSDMFGAFKFGVDMVTRRRITEASFIWRRPCGRVESWWS